MANAGSLIVFYVLFFMSVGITLPFLPVYYESLGIKPSEIGVLLSVGPAFALLAPPLWGQVADRTGRPGLVLFLISAGSLAGFGALLLATSFPAVFAALALFSLFGAATTTLIDSLALGHVEEHGGAFASIRTFGSAGFVAATLAFGFFVDVIDRRVVFAALALMGAYTAWAGLTLARRPARRREGPRADLRGALALLRNPQVRWLLVASAAHWIACAPYHGSLGLHFKALGFPPSTLGLSASVAVTSEIVVLFTWPRWAHLVRPRALLAIAFVVSAARWGAMAFTSSPVALVALAATHGISFGAFYVASISWVADRAPPSLRATGQSLFVAATFGIGGLVGFTGSGRLYASLGGHRLFGVAALAEVVPLMVLGLLLAGGAGRMTERNT
ncbi:MAG: MFS transporter [Myxococcaceae bacterium]|nr:MFS transporter [Myxococcaceae bacterium]